MSNANRARDFFAGLSVNELLIGGLGLLALYIWWHGPAAAGAQAGKLLIDTAGGAVRGAVDAIGQGFGLPPIAQETTDPAVSRWIMDNPLGGKIKASEWSSAPAFFSALSAPAGSGTPPAPDSPIAAAFPNYSQTQTLITGAGGVYSPVQGDIQGPL
jgi:hypothetical protein